MDADEVTFGDAAGGMIGGVGVVFTGEAFAGAEIGGNEAAPYGEADGHEGNESGRGQFCGERDPKTSNDSPLELYLFCCLCSLVVALGGCECLEGGGYGD